MLTKCYRPPSRFKPIEKVKYNVTFPVAALIYNRPSTFIGERLILAHQATQYFGEPLHALL